jgi:general secretion pathway protein L
LALGFSACVLALTVGGLKYLRQDAAIQDVDAQVAATRVKAQHVRAMIDKIVQTRTALAQLRAKRGDSPGLLDVWEEVTRVLPSHSWLIDLKLSEMAGKAEPQVAISGFSAAATNLVGLVEQSPLFVEASLTAPVALDPVEARERFALQAKVKKREPLREARR